MATAEQINTIEDFWCKVDKSAGADACWPWIGTINSSRGYGDFHFDGARIYAHRMAFKLTYGYLPNFSKRYCKMPHCCNPIHMTDKFTNNASPSVITYFNIRSAETQTATRGKFKSREATIVQWSSVFPSEMGAREAARKVGKSHYFSGRPCRNKHRGNRYVISGQCVDCSLLATRISYGRNAASPEWKKEHVIRVGAWAKNNIERVRNNKRRYSDKPESKEKKKKYFQLTKHFRKSAFKIYYAKNKEKYSVFSRNRKARMRGAEGSFTAKEIRELYRKQKGKCAICFTPIYFGKKGQPNTFHRDHYFPLIDGGSNYIWNIQLACGPCNLRKGRKDPFVFSRELGRLL